jgi:SAM-dependent methyltransferase
MRLANGQDDFLNPKMFGRLDSFHPRRAILNALKKQLPNFHGTLLDIGCGQMPYKPILLSSPSRVSTYVGLDLRDGQYARFGPFDLVWDGLHIPLEDNSIDCAIATEIFEQCQDPEIVMRETKRVLKAGGILFFTVPFLWPIHDPPMDQYRFTPYALERQLRNSGFADIKLEMFGGWDASLAQMIALWVCRRPMRSWCRRILSIIALPLVQLLGRLDRPPTFPEKFQSTVMVTGFAGTAVKSIES